MNRRLLSACIGLLAALGTATGVQAGGGHHHHHGHGGGWHVDFIFGGGGWPGYYRPYPYYNYYYPAPVVYAAPTVVTVPQITQIQTPQITVPATASTTNAPSSSSSSVVRSNSVPRTAGVTIRNPIASGTSIAFVVDSRTEAELAPGETMPLVEKSSYFIEFDRGGDYGTAKKTLGEGTYEFVATANGWDLQRADATDAVPTPVVRRNTLPTTR